MSEFAYRTIADTYPQGKSNVYFSCHPKDFEIFFEEYSKIILKIQDCAIWYENLPNDPFDIDDLQQKLSQMQLIIVPVTTRLLIQPNRAIEVEIPYALEHHIPVLPLMMEKGLVDIYQNYFGNLQYLDPLDKDASKLNFDHVLKGYIRSVLVSDEMAQQVRAAFDAYIFLSYRKKDRKKAQELIKIIHDNPVCRDIAIWYDEFLTPGEDFNQMILSILEKCDLFTLAVTPNLVNESNYVMTTEYPQALKKRKPILPVEMEPTDRGKLEEHFATLPACIAGNEPHSVISALVSNLKALAITTNDEDPKHCYLIGLAYLDGIDVEVDVQRAATLIEGAANHGVPEAMEQLWKMYSTGNGVRRNEDNALFWLEKYMDQARELYKTDPSEENGDKFLDRLDNLASQYRIMERLDEERAIRFEMASMLEELIRNGKEQYSSRLSVCYQRLGNNAYLKRDLKLAREYYEKGLDFCLDQTDLSYLCGDLAKTLSSMGDLNSAKTYFEKSLHLLEAVAEKQRTENVLYNLANLYREVAVFYWNNLRIRDKSKDDEPGFSGYYVIKMLEIAKKLAEDYDISYYQSFLAYAYDCFANHCWAKYDRENAGQNYQKSIFYQEAVVHESDTIQNQIDLAAYCNHYGDFLRLQEQYDEALPHLEKACKIYESLLEKVNSYKIRDLTAMSYENLCGLGYWSENKELALNYLGKCLALREALACETETIDDWDKLANIYFRATQVYDWLLDRPVAMDFYEKCLAARERAVILALTPETAYKLADVCSRYEIFLKRNGTHLRVHDEKFSKGFLKTKRQQLLNRILEICAPFKNEEFQREIKGAEASLFLLSGEHGDE